MKRFAIAIAMGAASISAFAQMSPVGLWKSISDKDGSVTAEIRIVEVNGVLSGKIERQLGAKAKPDDKCTQCKDDRKDQLIVGMEIIRGAKKADGENVWEGGKILDPDEGKEYKLKLMPTDGGTKLGVRGYIAFFYRTQTWVRAQ